MKVLVSAYACNPAGSLVLHPGEDLTGWRLVQQLARFHELWVVSHTYNRAEILNSLGHDHPRNIHFHFVDLASCFRWLYKIEFGQRIFYYLWQIKAWRVSRKLHKEVGFDIAHHVTFGNDWIPSYIGAFLPVPFIWGPVGGGQDTPLELRGEYSLYGRLAEQVRRTAQWFGRRDLVRRRSLANAKAVLVCNRETKAKVPKKYEHKVLFFPVNGISEEDLMVPGEVSSNGREFRVLTAGRLHPLKGFALALRSFERFSRTCPDSTLVILGEGPEEDRLRRLVRRLGIESQVRFLSWLPRKDVLREMTSCSVFLFTSFRDGGGAVVVEAMACGRPVIGLNSGGPGLHIEEPWGFRIEPKHPDDVEREISNALETLYVNPGLRRRMGEAARRRAKEFYLWDRLGERLRVIYEEAWTSPD